MTGGEVTLFVLLVIVALLVLLAWRSRSSGPPGVIREPTVEPAAEFATDASSDAAYPTDDDADTDAASDDDTWDDTSDDQPTLDDALANLLANPTSAFVILQGDRGYVQFAPAPNNGLYGEAVSSEFLAANDKLTPDEHARILALGWDDAQQGGNYTRLFVAPVDVTAAADLAQKTLEVYGDSFDSAAVETE